MGIDLREVEEPLLADNGVDGELALLIGCGVVAVGGLGRIKTFLYLVEVALLELPGLGALEDAALVEVLPLLGKSGLT